MLFSQSKTTFICTIWCICNRVFCWTGAYKFGCSSEGRLFQHTSFKSDWLRTNNKNRLKQLMGKEQHLDKTLYRQQQSLKLSESSVVFIIVSKYNSKNLNVKIRSQTRMFKSTWSILTPSANKPQLYVVCLTKSTRYMLVIFHRNARRLSRSCNMAHALYNPDGLCTRGGTTAAVRWSMSWLKMLQ